MIIELKLEYLLYTLYGYLGVALVAAVVLALISWAGGRFDLWDVIVSGLKWPVYLWFIIFR